MTDLTPPVIKRKFSEYSESRIMEDPELEYLRPDEDEDPGRPTHVPNDTTKAAVTLLSAFGIAQIKIAAYIGLKSDKTLRKHYRTQLDAAETTVDAAVISAWMKNVQDGKEMTVLRYMERKFLKPDAPPPPPSPERVEATAERVRELVKKMREEF